MEIPLRTAYGQAGRCGMQPKPSSLRAQAHQSKSRTDTKTAETLEKKLREREKENARADREVTSSINALISSFKFHPSTRRVADQVDRSERAVRNCWEQWTREGTHVLKTGSGATMKTTRREDQRIVRQALVDPTVTRSTIRADVGVAIVPQTISRHLAEANLKSKRPFRALPLTPEISNCVYSGAKPDQCGMSQIDKRLCLVMNPGLFWGQMITVFGCGGALVSGPFLNGLPGAIFQQDNARPHTARVAQDFLRHFQTLPWPARSPDLSPVEYVWDQLKRQMPSCHSVHDLELAVQDLWAHLPQDNIKCLINSMPDRVAACIAAGGGPTRY
ncbi:transposable element Tcb2 transposase [Trichonephila clavipes]|nr:transposable element Tcb2 transposase [Trichonephila clavipes]